MADNHTNEGIATRKSQAMLDSAQRIAHLGSWELDLGSNKLAWSDEVFRIFEIDKGRFGASYEAFLNLIHPDDREKVNKAYSDSLKNKAPYEIVHRLKFPDGRIKYVVEQCETIYDSAGKPLVSIGCVQDITDRKMREDEIEKLSRFPNENPYPVLRVSKDGEILYANQASALILGKWDGKAGTAVPAGFLANVKESLLKQKSGEVDLDVGGRIFSCVLAPIRDGNYVNVYGRDITEHRKAEEALKREKEFSDNILNTMPDGLDIVDENLRIIHMNKALEALFGKDAIGKQCYDVYRTDHNQCENCPLRTPMGEGTRTLEVSGIKGDKTFLISHTAIVLNGKRHILEIFRDITSRKKIEEQLRLRSAALESAANAIVLTDKNGAITWVNPAFTALTGYSAQEVVGGNPRLLKSGKHSTEFYQNIWGTINSGKVWHGEVFNRKKDGTIYPEEMTITPLRDESGEILNFIAIKNDITERKEAEESILTLNSVLKDRTIELEAVNRELEAFSYSTSHDLRAPLRGIDGFSQALLEEYDSKLDDAGKDYLTRIRRATARMGQLIDDLLNLSRIARAELNVKDVDLSALVRSISAKLQEAEPNREVEFVVQNGIVARCDKSLLQQVLENFISNAWKFTAKHPTARIEFGSTQKDGSTAYFVRDNGAGFDMAYVQKLFIPFQRLHSAQEFPGTGIGLAIVSRIISRHGGKVWAEGQVDKGATFYFTL